MGEGGLQQNIAAYQIKERPDERHRASLRKITDVQLRAISPIRLSEVFTFAFTSVLYAPYGLRCWAFWLGPVERQLPTPNMPLYT